MNARLRLVLCAHLQRLDELEALDMRQVARAREEACDQVGLVQNGKQWQQAGTEATDANFPQQGSDLGLLSSRGEERRAEAKGE